MAIDYSALGPQAISKGTPRVVDRLARKQAYGAAERACRKAVRARDKGRCRVPWCHAAAVHQHHLVYRAQGGTWTPGNIVSLCATCHQLVHAHQITITGNADKQLTFGRRRPHGTSSSSTGSAP